MLEILGLSPREQSLYEVMIARSPASTAEVAELTDDLAAIDRLRELGLVSVVAADPPRYVVLPPEAALTRLARDRDRRLAAARQHMIELTVKFHSGVSANGSSGLVDVVTGASEVARACGQVQASVRRWFAAWDAPPYVRGSPGTNQTQHEMMRGGVTCQVVYDRTSVVSQPGRLMSLQDDISGGEEARIADVPTKMCLSDHPMVFMSLDAKGDTHRSAMLIRDPTTCAALAALFRVVWDRAVPLGTFRQLAQDDARTAAGQTDQPAGAERHLLALLLSGFTDEQIATHLGCSKRTVGHRVSALRARLGADTRFQAGYQAVRRGWLTAQDRRYHA